MLRDDKDFRDFDRPERNFEEDNLTGKNKQDSVLANTPLHVLTAKSIIGERVENVQGEKLGEIKDIMLNMQTKCIEYMVLESGGFLGMGEKLFAIPINAIMLNTERRVFVLDKSKEEIKKAPGFDKDHWPETNSRHFDEVNYFWGYMGPYGVNDSNGGFTV